MHRRTFLSLAGLTPFLGINASAMNELKSDKAVVFLYLHGGISVPESINPVPQQQDKFRSVTGFQKGKHFLLGGSFVNTIGVSDKISLVHSFSHKDANHSTAGGQILSGHLMAGIGESGAMTEPAIGSLITKYIGPRHQSGVPHYVKMNKIEYGGIRRDTEAWLTMQEIGFDADEEGIKNLKFNIPLEQLNRRMEFVRAIDRQTDPVANKWSELREESYKIVTGKAAEAFDLSKESIENQNKFKAASSQFGKSILTTIRLIKSGTKFVQLINAGWDMHNDILQGYQARGPELDWGIHLLITELEANGLLDKTLIVITSEFGRTAINANNGRDHNPGLTMLMFAGGGYDHGRIIGKASNDSLSVDDNPITPKDLIWTIGNHFDMPKDTTYVDGQKRPHHIFDDGAKNILL